MKELKLIVTAIICALILIFLVGCWDYREINELEIVSGFAIDKDKETDKYIMTVESFAPSEKSENMYTESKIYVAQGDTVFDAIRSMIIKSGQRLYWSHTKVLIISEEVAREGLITVIDFIDRDIEARADIWLIISREKTAGEILKTKPQVESTTSGLINYALINEKSIHTYHGVQVWKFIKDLEEEKKSPVLPAIKNVIRNGKLYPYLYGVGVLKEDKLVGWLNHKETKYYLFAIDEIEGGVIPLKNVNNTGTNVTLEIFGSNTKLKPVIKEGKLLMNIFVETDVDIAEIMGSEDFIYKEGRNILAKEGEKFLEKEILTVIKKVQKEYESDIFGFSSAFHRAYPSEWKRIKSNWDEIFVDLDVNVNVTLNIESSAITSTPIKGGK